MQEAVLNVALPLKLLNSTIMLVQAGFGVVFGAIAILRFKTEAE
jgi:hypothetical protein